MLNRPRKTKYTKIHKGNLKNLDYKANCLTFGTIGLKSTESGSVNSKQIESARQAIARKIKRQGKVWIRIFPQIPVSAKSTGVRMGKGKGNVSHWVAKVKNGTVLFEICGIEMKVALIAFRTGGAKLPVNTKIFT